MVGTSNESDPVAWPLTSVDHSEASKQGLTKENAATMVAIWYNHVRSTKLGTIYGFSLKDTLQKEVLAGGV